MITFDVSQGWLQVVPFSWEASKLKSLQDDHESYFDLQLYVPSFQDCLNFIHHGKVNVHRDAVICTVDETDTNKTLLHKAVRGNL